MRLESAVLLSLVMGLLAGCAGAVPIVRSAAVEDFQCPAERVGVARLGNGRYRALGCGQRGIYECAVADDYVCTMETNIENVETSDQVVRQEANDSLMSSLDRCELVDLSVTITFDEGGQASAVEFEGEPTSAQRSCVAHAAANHTAEDEAVVEYPAPSDSP